MIETGGCKGSGSVLELKFFLGLDVDVSLIDSPVGKHTAEDAPLCTRTNKATNKSSKMRCTQMPRIATE